jgi:hypothetical protein
MKSNWIYSLTPEEAWAEYVSDSVELFVSFSYEEGSTNIADACRNHSREIPNIYEKPFLQSHLDHIADLLERHIDSYITSIGGLSNLRIYTKDELEGFWKDEVDDLIEIITRFVNGPKPIGSSGKR